MTDRPPPRPPRKSAPAPIPQRLTRDYRQRFTARLLAKLPPPDEDPVSTNELGAFFQLDQYQRSNLLWNALDRLAKDGLVERIAVDGENVRYWRRTPAGQQQAQDTDHTA